MIKTKITRKTIKQDKLSEFQGWQRDNIPGSLFTSISYMTCFNTFCFANTVMLLGEQGQNNYKEPVMIICSNKIAYAYVITPSKIGWTYMWHLENRI